MTKLKINDQLAAQAKDCAGELGYSSLDEFVEHLLEKILSEHQQQEAADRELVEQRLKGLGYIE